MQSGTKSVELKALKRSSDVFCSGVDPNTLATKLMAEELFTSEEYERATQRTATNHQRNNEILTALVRRVSADSRVFHTVVRLLQQEPALKAVGDRMQAFMCEISPLMSLQKFMKRNVRDSRNHKQQCVCVVVCVNFPPT